MSSDGEIAADGIGSGASVDIGLYYKNINSAPTQITLPSTVASNIAGGYTYVVANGGKIVTTALTPANNSVALYWPTPTSQPITLPYSNTQSTSNAAAAVNASGVIVGSEANGLFAVRWIPSGSTMVCQRMNDLMTQTAGWSLSSCLAVNAFAGWVLGIGSFNGVSTYFLLPAPRQQPNPKTVAEGAAVRALCNIRVDHKLRVRLSAGF